MNIAEISLRVAAAEQAIENFDAGKSSAIRNLEIETGLKVSGYSMDGGRCRIDARFPTGGFKEEATKSQESVVKIV